MQSTLRPDTSVLRLINLARSSQAALPQASVLTQLSVLHVILLLIPFVVMDMHACLVYSLILTVHADSANALPAALHASDTSPENTRWSKEAILALVSVLVAILLFMVGLASQTIRRCVMNTFSCTCIYCLSSGDEAYFNSLQQAAYLL